MEIQTNITDKECVVKLVGRLDTTTAPALEMTLEETFEEHNFDKLIFDFEKLDYISSAGLRIMLSNKKTMSKVEKDMEIVNANESIIEIFEVTGFNEILIINKQN